MIARESMAAALNWRTPPRFACFRSYVLVAPNLLLATTFAHIENAGTTVVAQVVEHAPLRPHAIPTAIALAVRRIVRVVLVALMAATVLAASAQAMSTATTPASASVLLIV